jgi:hypothetical protein
MGPYGPFTGYAAVLGRSRFLKPVQKLLEEICNMGGRPPQANRRSLDEILFLLRGEESREQLMVSSLMLHSMCESLFTVLPQLIFCACDLMILLLVVDMDCDSSSFWICFFVYYMYQIKPVLCTVTPTSFIFSFLP